MLCEGERGSKRAALAGVTPHRPDRQAWYFGLCHYPKQQPTRYNACCRLSSIAAALSKNLCFVDASGTKRT
ncbi:unnamed protein product [Ectocarpus fasciculatus]